MAGRISAANKDLVSLQCDFDQEKELSFLEDKALSSGRFYFRAKDKIRWEYEKPYPYVIVMNGSVVRITDGSKTQRQDASASRLFSSINAVMTGVIDGSALTGGEYFQSTFFESSSQFKVELVPVSREMKEFIAAMEVYLDKPGLGVSALKIVEKSGDYTLIRFKNRQINAPIPEAVFSVD